MTASIPNAKSDNSSLTHICLNSRAAIKRFTPVVLDTPCTSSVGTVDKNRLTSIIIRTCHELIYLRLCVESIFQNTDSAFELIFVNDGLNGPTVDYLKSIQNRYGCQYKKKKPTVGSACTKIQLVLNRETTGSSFAKNQGLAFAQGSYLLLLNSDTVVTSGWLMRLIKSFEHSPSIGIVGPRSNEASGPQRVESLDYDTIGLNGLDIYSEALAQKYDRRITSYWPVDGFCMMIKRAVIEKIGGFDTRFVTDCMETEDFCLRAALACFEAYVAEDSFVHHFAAQNTHSLRQDEKTLFNSKWRVSKTLPHENRMDPDSVRIHGFNRFQHFISLPEIEKITAYGPIINQPLAEPYQVEEKKRVRLPEYDSNVSVSIILLTSGLSSHTQKSLSRIVQHTKLSHEIIIVEKNPKDKIFEGLKSVDSENLRLQIVTSVTQRNPAQSLNAGIQVSRGQYLVMMTDQVLVTNGWIDGLIQAYNRCHSTALVGPVTNLPEGRQQDVFSTDMDPVALNRHADSFRQRYRYRNLSAYDLSGFCLMTHRTIVEKIGLFDENHETHKGCIKDYCLRTRLSGFDLRIAADTWVGGYSNPSTDKNRSGSVDLNFLDRRYYQKKWQGIKARSEIGRQLVTARALKKADRFHQMEKIKDATDTLLQAIKYDTEEPRLYAALGQLLIESKYYQNALDVLSHFPGGKTDLRIHAMRAYCKEGLGHYEEALKDVQYILGVNPSQGLALNLRGILAYRSGDQKKAVEYFLQAMEAAPDISEPYVNYGYMLWGSKDYDGGLNLIEKGFFLDPLNIDHSTLYHSAIVQCRAYARGEVSFKDTCGCYPHSKRLKMLYIDTLIKQGKYETAMNPIEECLVQFENEKEFLTAAINVREKICSKKCIRGHKHTQRISLCMIVKDEEKYLARCLYSVKGLVDEMIVVDTGSTDNTKEIAEVFGANVYQIEWAYDFSKARNFSLSKATGNWVLILDADEVIAASDTCKLRHLVEKGPRQTAYAITTRNYYKLPNVTGWIENDGSYPDQEAGTGWKPSTKVRLFPNNDNIFFENAVHELVEYSVKRLNMKIRRVDIPIHHYGKLNAQKTEAKGNQYFKIGEKKLNAKGDLQALAELAVQASELGDHQNAMDLWEELLEEKPDYAMGYLHISNSSMELGQFAKARDLCEKAMALKPDLKEAALNRAVCEMNLGHFHEAIEIIEDLLSRTPDYPPAIGVLATAYCLIDNQIKGAGYLDKLRKMGYNCSEYIYKRACQLININKMPEAKTLLEMALSQNYVSKEILELIAEVYRIQNND